MVVGNWKMNKLPKEGSSFVEESVNLLLDVERVQVIFCPPFTGLLGMNLEHPFSLGSQNCHWEDQGAFTGEISTRMLKDCGVSYVILGHSERRQIFFETNDWIKWKMGAVVDAGLIPIFCIGEAPTSPGMRAKFSTPERLRFMLHKTKSCHTSPAPTLIVL